MCSKDSVWLRGKQKNGEWLSSIKNRVKLNFTNWYGGKPTDKSYDDCIALTTVSGPPNNVKFEELEDWWKKNRETIMWKNVNCDVEDHVCFNSAISNSNYRLLLVQSIKKYVSISPLTFSEV